MSALMMCSGYFSVPAGQRSAVNFAIYGMLENKKQCRAAFMALKYLYPKAVFPNVYFVIGRFNSGGHSNPKGLIIGCQNINQFGLQKEIKTAIN